MRTISIIINGEERESIYYIFANNNMLEGGWLHKRTPVGIANKTLMRDVKKNIEDYFKEVYQTDNVIVQGLF